MNRLRGISGIETAQPYIVGKGTASLASGHMEDIWIIGADPMTKLGAAWSFAEGSVDDLRRPDGISFDEVDVPKLGDLQRGELLEVNGYRARVAARTRGITGFITMPYLFMTLNTARRIAPLPPGTCSFLLLKVRRGADVPASPTWNG